MNKITLAILTAAIAGFAAPASAQQSQIFAPKTPPTQRQSAQPPPNQRQFNQRQTTATPPAKATQPLPTFAIAVNGIAIQAARLRNHCVLDANIAADQTLITSIKNGFGGGGTYIAATIDCAGLTRLRAGNRTPSRSYAARMWNSRTPCSSLS